MQQIRALLPFVRRYRSRLLYGLLFAICASVTSALVPQVIRILVDELSTSGVVPGDLLRYGGLMLLIGVFDSLFRFGQRLTVNGASYLVEFDLRESMFAKLLTLDQRFYGRNHTGDLMTRVTNDLSAVRQFLGPGINSLMSAILLIAVAGSLMVLTNGILAAIVLLLLPFVTVLFVIVGARMRRLFRSVQDQFGDISTRAQENFSGIRTIKAYAQEDAEIGVFRAANEQYRRFNVRYVLLSGVLWPSISVILGFVGAVVLLVGGRFVASGVMTLGDLVLFNAYLGMLAFPMIALGWTVNLYQQCAASMTRIGEVVNYHPDITTPADAPDELEIAGEIEFRDVGIRFESGAEARNQEPEARSRDAESRSYPTSLALKRRDTDEQAGDEQQITLAPSRQPSAPSWMLHHISFRVPRGSSLAIVGATGAGKTTLVNLLARVRDPDEGAVLIDGADVRTLPLDALRRNIGYVPQDTFLFSVPVRDNVAFGRPDAGEEEIGRALEVSRLSNDVEQFPDGIDTMIGERGVTLSGGQKQRTAIARAVLRDPAILVLDDSLSSVDTHTAAQILGGLRSVMQGRTSIIIAQRIATVKDADQIIVLHEGEIAERGTHQQLLTENGRYAAMYRRELLEAELAGDGER